MLTRRDKIWMAASVVWVVINVGGAGFALAAGELVHGSIHLLLVIPGAVVLQQIARRRARRPALVEERAISIPTSKLDDRLAQLEQSVDAVAIEVTRMGEGQRTMTELFSERGTPRASAPSELPDGGGQRGRP